ncbi:radical SAM/SPASM domain-containing protein [Desulfolucanica intricata]|uniref:radical SAM/SPASM domain-containing protein n=1 Tax=Desulfolucanica intricata TaxID=1285191 RepID=UPI00082D4891|nr:radical SAM protein [Desulfolucanica intricata]
MIAAPDIPDNRISLTQDQLALFQNFGAKHISFSVTLACPLSCKHCIVGAGPHMQHTTMPLEHAEFYASQMKELAEQGVKSIGFTGGEPLLASKQVALISEKAAAAGLDCGIVTSGFFAEDKQTIIKLAKKYPAIKIWDISIDAYHVKYVAKNKIKLVYQVLNSLGLKANLRFTYHIPMTEQDRELYDFLKTFAEPNDLFSQKLRNYGRAGSINMTLQPENVNWNKPCMTPGLVIRYDGSVAPCCCSLVESRKHPFQFGSALERRLTDIHRDYMCHPLLQHIRILGFSELMRWLVDTDYFYELPEQLPVDICDLCPVIFEHPDISKYLYRRASKPDNILRTAVAAFRVLQERVMLEEAVKKFSNLRDRPEGYELACELLKNPDKYSLYSVPGTNLK